MGKGRRGASPVSQVTPAERELIDATRRLPQQPADGQGAAFLAYMKQEAAEQGITVWARDWYWPW